MGGDFGLGMFGLDVLGIPGTNNQGRTDVLRPDLYAGIPNLDPGFQTLGDTSTWTPQNRNEKTVSLTANLTKFAGRHELRGGYTLFRGTLDHWQPERENPRGDINIAGEATRMVGQNDNFYNNWAALLFGYTEEVAKSMQNEMFSVYEWTHAFFVRDRWNVTDKLTFDVGLRYEYYPIMRRQNRGMEMLDLDTLEIVIGGRGPDNPATALDESREDLGVQVEKDLFAPRFGAIYRINDRTVARAGYGLAYSGEGFTRPFRGDASYPGAINREFERATDGNHNWGWRARLADGIPFIDLPPDNLVRQPLPLTSSNTRTMVPETVIRPRIHSWNVALERQLPYSLTADVAYVGNRSDGQWTNFNMNVVTEIGGQNQQLPYWSKINPLTGEPFRFTQNINAYVGFDKVRYNSLQVGISRPFRQGLLLKGHYTLARTRNFERDYTIPTPEIQARNWFNTGRTHTLAMSFVYMLPWQTGRGPGGLLRTIINDWQVNGIWQMYSGSRFSVTADDEEWDTQDNPQRADLVGPVVKLGRIGAAPQPGPDGVLGSADDIAGCLACDNPGPYYDPYAWAQPTGQRLGTSLTNQFTGPGATNLDFSIFRAVPLGGNRRLEIRFEANNVLNRPKWANPNASLNYDTFNADRTVVDPDFMVIDDTVGDMRQARIALRFSY
jgi:hypothetical protein